MDCSLEQLRKPFSRSGWDNSRSRPDFFYSCSYIKIAVVSDAERLFYNESVHIHYIRSVKADLRYTSLAINVYLSERKLYICIICLLQESSPDGSCQFRSYTLKDSCRLLCFVQIQYSFQKLNPPLQSQVLFDNSPQFHHRIYDLLHKLWVIVLLLKIQPFYIRAYQRSLFII